MDTRNLDEQFQLAFGELEGRLDYAELLLLNAIQQLSALPVASRPITILALAAA